MADPIVTTFYEDLLNTVQQIRLQVQSSPIWFGGAAGPSGGSGGRPGGYVGKLPQNQITYDTTEAATILGSGNLVDNLNHIRADIVTLSGLVGSGISFLSLIDTPTQYTSQAGKVLTVNLTEDVLEFTTAGIVTTSDDNVSNPPSDAELDSAFGTPGVVGDGFLAVVDDNGAGTTGWLVWSDGTNWWYTAGTKAT